MLDAGQPPLFEAKLFKHNGEDIEVANQEAADKIVAAVSKAKWQVASVTQREKKRNPPPPFTTSKLQQASYNRLRYSAKNTMRVAQGLYEGVELGDRRLRCADYLHAHRFGERFAGCARASARTHSRKIWLRVFAGKAQLLQVQEGCARGARSRSPDGRDAHSGRRPQISERRSIQALSIDLAEVRGFPNDAGRVRSNDDRHFGVGLYVPCDGNGAEIRRLFGRVSVRGCGYGRRRKDATKARAMRFPASPKARH